jgi:hypothetical protein
MDGELFMARKFGIVQGLVFDQSIPFFPDYERVDMTIRTLSINQNSLSFSKMHKQLSGS